MNRRRPPALVALSPGDLSGAGPEAVRRFLDAARDVVREGLCGIVVREPSMGDRSLLELAREVRAILAPDGWLAIHDRVHLAGACGAQAVHLGFRSLRPRAARCLLPPETAIGFSAHEGDDRELWSDSDYIFFGPVLDTPSKLGLKTPVGFSGLAAAVAGSPVPVWAIGGLAPEHAAACVEAGCAGVAVRSRIFAAHGGADAGRGFLRALDRAGRPAGPPVDGTSGACAAAV